MKIWKKLKLNDLDPWFVGDILCASEKTADTMLTAKAPLREANRSTKSGIIRGYAGHGYWILREVEQPVNEFGEVSP